MKMKHDLAKWLSGEMTAEELDEFKKLPEFESYQRIADYSNQLQPAHFDSEALLKTIVSREKKTPKIVRLRSMWKFKVAAILIVGLGSFFFFQMTKHVSESTAAGQISSFNLPDKSEVTLNSDSEIQFKNWNWEQNRQLQLDGEAFFKVQKGKTFTVATSLGTVTVVGTQFSVKARKNRFEVECFEGKVKVDIGAEHCLLSKGQIIVIENGQILPASPSNAERPLWTQHQIRVISGSLQAIIAEIERVYAVAIEFNGAIPNEKFTGILPSDDLTTVLKTLANTYRLDYKPVAKNKIILTEK